MAICNLAHLGTAPHEIAAVGLVGQHDVGHRPRDLRKVRRRQQLALGWYRDRLFFFVKKYVQTRKCVDSVDTSGGSIRVFGPNAGRRPGQRCLARVGGGA